MNEARFSVRQFESLIRSHSDAMENLNNYQSRTNQTAIYDDKGTEKALAYLSSGIASEAGEVCGVLKRHLRDNRPIHDHEITALVEELGDVMWYISEIASYFNIPLRFIAAVNIAKLKERHAGRFGDSDIGHASASKLGSGYVSGTDRSTGKSPPRTSHGPDTSVRSSDASEESVSRRKGGRVVREKVRPLQRATRKNRKSV